MEETNNPSSKLDKTIVTAQKYTFNGILHEAVIVGGKPYFLRMDEVEQKPILLEQIELPDGTVFVPPKKNECLNKPYDFASIQAIRDMIKTLDGFTFDNIYQLVKEQIDSFVDRPEHQKILYAADIVFTYFQDIFGTTHYLFLYGDNDSGKTADIRTIGCMAYRPLIASGLTSANIYQYLGEHEEGQGTILEEEADDIDTAKEKMRIYKNGYNAGTKIPRMDISNGRVQHGYWTYGFKAFCAERQLDLVDAKGFNDRTFYFHCYPGKPRYYIKEVLESAGDDRFEQMKGRLDGVRNLLFIFRMIHYNDKFPNVETTLANRNRELTISLIRLFQGSEILESAILLSLSRLLSEKQERKKETLESRLFHVVLELLGLNTDGFILSREIWETFKAGVEGEPDPHKTTTYNTTEYGPVTPKKIAGILTSRFGAVRGHTEQGNGFIFNMDELNSLRQNYDSANIIKIEILQPKPMEGNDDVAEAAAIAV